MFNKKIRDTTLTSDLANDYFTISGDSFAGDRSFISTLRALLHKRCRGENVFFAVCSRGTSQLLDIAGLQPQSVFNAFSPIPDERNSLKLLNLTGTQESNALAFSLYDDPTRGFSATNPDYPEAKDLRAFVKNRGKLNARFYISKSKREAVVLCENLTLPAYHLLQSLTPRLFPYFFEDTPLETDELALLDALTLRTATEYERVLALLASHIDFREHTIRKIVGDFEQSGRREEIQRTQNEIDRCRSEINNLNERYTLFLAKIDDLNIRLAGQEMALASASDGSELIDYFLCNRNIDPVRVNGRSIMFTVKTFLESFDPEQFRTYSQNPRSCLYEGYRLCGKFADIENRRKMLNAIFSDEPLLRVRICSNYMLDLRGSSSCCRLYDYGNGFMDYVPNPHIHHFACLGNYARYINQALQRGDVIGAIEQCVASAKSLNLAESSTVRYFLNDVFNSTHNIIRLPDGRDVTPGEALDYLNSLEEKKEESNV